MFSRLITPKQSKPTVSNCDSDKCAFPTRTPHVTVSENDENYELLIRMPGVAPDKAEITVNNGVLTIEGALGEHSSLPLVHREYMEHNYKRSFTVPKGINVSAIQATSKHGILHVVLPKVSEAQPRKIAISVK